MSEVTLTIFDRKMSWTIPDNVAPVMLESFIQVCGPGEDVTDYSEMSDDEVSSIVSGARTGNLSGTAGAGVGTTIEQLKDKQYEVCSYNTREGDGNTCDCKYMHPLDALQLRVRGEVTGCCELRAAIQVLSAIEGRKKAGLD